MLRLHTTDAPPTPAQNSAERLNGKPAEPANGKPGEPHENANATDNQAKPSKDPGSSVERAEELDGQDRRQCGHVRCQRRSQNRSPRLPRRRSFVRHLGGSTKHPSGQGKEHTSPPW